MDRAAGASIAGKVAFNTLVQLGGKVIVLASAVVLTSFLTRFLGQEGYGDYTIVFAYLGVASIFIDFGIQTIAVREISKGEHGVEEITNNVFTLKAVLAIAVLLLGDLLIFLSPYSQAAKFGVLIASIAVWLDALTTPMGVVFQARLQMQYPMASGVAARLTVLGLSALVISIYKLTGIGPSLAAFYWLIAANVGASATRLIVGYGFLRRAVKFKPAFNGVLIGRLIQQALPLAVVLIMGQALLKIDTIALSLLRPSTEVGIYGVSHKVLDLVILFPGLFMTSVFPFLSRYVDGDERRFGLAMQRSFDFMVMAGVPMVAGVVLLAPGIVDLLGGVQFAGSALPLRIMIFAGFFSFLNSVFLYGLIAEGRQREMSWVYLAGVASNIVLNLIFIPTYGYLAAAFTSVFSQLLCSICLVYLASLRRGFFLSLGSVSKAILASIAMVLALSVLHVQVLLGVLIGAAVYFVTLYLLKGFNKEAILALIQASKERTL